MRPARDSPRFIELLHFMSHVAACYPEVSLYTYKVYNYTCMINIIRGI